MNSTITLAKTGETKYSFEYPITYAKKVPAVYVGKLNVTACVSIGRENQIISVKILKITYWEKNTRMPDDIKSLLEVIAPEFYMQVYDAATTYAEDVLLNK